MAAEAAEHVLEWRGGGTGVRGHLTYKKRANQVQHKQQVIYSKHAVHLQLLIKSPIAINFKGKKVKTIFVFWNEHLKQWFPTGGSRSPRVATQRLGTTDLEAYIVVTYLVYFSHEFINLYLNFPKKCIRRSFLLTNSLAMSVRLSSSVLCLWTCKINKLLYLFSVIVALRYDFKRLWTENVLSPDATLIGVRRYIWSSFLIFASSVNKIKIVWGHGGSPT